MYMTAKKPNHLIREISPYLLQHAYNPVNWHPWTAETLNKAREQNKLMIISIGYAACHWCHVMEHESFEDELVAVEMNRDFISVKVDREERPDVDHVYMNAAYATTGRGGWPLNVIALPDQRPVFAGTYFSKHDWLNILRYFSDLYARLPEELRQQAEETATGMLIQHQVPLITDHGPFESPVLDHIFTSWEEELDFDNGGTPGAPKFPMPGNIGYLLNYGARHQNVKVMNYVALTMDKMAMGGIYDQLGGGFSRYSVDSRWHVPHFEKMLCDNAQLISLYSGAYRATKNQSCKKVVEETAAFIEREMTSKDGLFYASIDADSKGTEGAFYTWTTEEIRKYILRDPQLFLDYYSCEESGNWEHGLNVLRRSLHDEDFAAIRGLSADQLSASIDAGKNLLLAIRGKRIHPATDDKILTCWNALMISALVDAAKALHKPVWLEKAIAAANFYRVRLDERKGKLWRNSGSGSYAIAGFLDDYCFLIKSFLDIYQSTLHRSWLEAADLMIREVLSHFTARDGIFFSLSSDEVPALIQETVELSDNVIPSSNSQMARNLYVTGNILGREEYILRSETMLKKMIPRIKRNPSFHANWTNLLADFISGFTEVKIEGDEKLVRLQEFSEHFLPQVIFSGDLEKSIHGIHENLQLPRKTLISVCHGKTCYSPVETVQEALQILEKKL